MLQFVRVDRHVPSDGQLFQCAHVVEVPVGQHDREGPPAVAEAFRRGTLDRVGRARNAGVDQDPSAIARVGHTDEDDVHDHETLVCDVGRDLMRAIIGILTAIVGARVRTQRYQAVQLDLRSAGATPLGNRSRHNSRAGDRRPGPRRHSPQATLFAILPSKSEGNR